MKLVLLGLLVGFLQASGESNAPVALFARFEQPISETVTASLKSELDSIMEPAGFHFEWRELPKASGREVHRELVVVGFQGACRVRDVAVIPNAPRALGWTHTSGDALLPFVDVQCDRVSSLLRSEFPHVDPEERDEVLGRALGRVLAHELYHVLGRTKKHGSGGIAKGTYSAAELTAGEMLLNEADVRRLRANRPEFNHEPVEPAEGH